jgi:hypothetical protein
MMAEQTWGASFQTAQQQHLPVHLSRSISAGRKQRLVLCIVRVLQVCQHRSIACVHANTVAAAAAADT